MSLETETRSTQHIRVLDVDRKIGDQVLKACEEGEIQIVEEVLTSTVTSMLKFNERLRFRSPLLAVRFKDQARYDHRPNEHWS